MPLMSSATASSITQQARVFGMDSWFVVDAVDVVSNSLIHDAASTRFWDEQLVLETELLKVPVLAHCNLRTLVSMPSKIMQQFR